MLPTKKKTRSRLDGTLAEEKEREKLNLLHKKMSEATQKGEIFIMSILEELGPVVMFDTHRRDKLTIFISYIISSLVQNPLHYLSELRLDVILHSIVYFVFTTENLDITLKEKVNDTWRNFKLSLFEIISDDILDLQECEKIEDTIKEFLLNNTTDEILGIIVQELNPNKKDKFHKKIDNLKTLVSKNRLSTLEYTNNHAQILKDISKYKSGVLRDKSSLALTSIDNDFTKFKTTPMKVITCEQAHDVICGLRIPNDCVGKKVFVLDARHPYEYEAGHIQGAMNIWNHSSIINLLFHPDKFDDYKDCLFLVHCEFSSWRGPSLLFRIKTLADQMMDRIYGSTEKSLEDKKTKNDDQTKKYVKKLEEINFKDFFKHMYIIEGGYAKFFKNYSQLCTPKFYLGQRDIMLESTYARKLAIKLNMISNEDVLSHKKNINMYYIKKSMPVLKKHSPETDDNRFVIHKENFDDWFNKWKVDCASLGKFNFGFDMNDYFKQNMMEYPIKETQQMMELTQILKDQNKTYDDIVHDEETMDEAEEGEHSFHSYNYNNSIFNRKLYEEEKKQEEKKSISPYPYYYKTPERDVQEDKDKERIDTQKYSLYSKSPPLTPDPSLQHIKEGDIVELKDKDEDVIMSQPQEKNAQSKKRRKEEELSSPPRTKPRYLNFVSFRDYDSDGEGGEEEEEENDKRDVFSQTFSPKPKVLKFDSSESEDEDEDKK